MKLGSRLLLKDLLLEAYIESKAHLCAFIGTSQKTVT